jgi:hypothetical protein
LSILLIVFRHNSSVIFLLPDREAVFVDDEDPFGSFLLLLNRVAELLLQVVDFSLVLFEGLSKRVRICCSLKLLKHLSFFAFEEIIDKLGMVIVEMFQ